MKRTHTVTYPSRYIRGSIFGDEREGVTHGGRWGAVGDLEERGAPGCGQHDGGGTRSGREQAFEGIADRVRSFGGCGLAEQSAGAEANRGVERNEQGCPGGGSAGLVDVRLRRLPCDR